MPETVVSTVGSVGHMLSRVNRELLFEVRGFIVQTQVKRSEEKRGIILYRIWAEKIGGKSRISGPM